MAMVVEAELFILSTCLTTLNTCELVMDGTVVGKANKEEKTREVADIGMCIISVGIFFN